MTVLLELRDVSVRFGNVQAVRDVSASFPAGRLTGLIGPNGAGKTTLIDAITGFVPVAGSIVFDGRDVSRLPAHRRARMGLARTWQSVELFDDLTVLENLEVGLRDQGARAVVRDLIRPPVRRAVAAAERALAAVGLEGRLAERPGELSYGERKLVGLARVLMLEPRFILLDEPAAGLDTHESAALGARLREIAASGVGLLLVDHDMSLVLGSCEYVHVLQFGELVADGTPAHIRADERVIAAYLGTAPTPEALA